MSQQAKVEQDPIEVNGGKVRVLLVSAICRVAVLVLRCRQGCCCGFLVRVLFGVVVAGMAFATQRACRSGSVWGEGSESCWWRLLGDAGRVLVWVPFWM